MAVFSKALLCSWGEGLAKVAEDQSVGIIQCELSSFFTEEQREDGMRRDI